ncbi:MAG: RHS repeat-associated core domain-containing protein [Saprospiraceae bacterium]|nr:RHS repeat-associated core domain-containing protein [Saprospiraceae bacterium]MCB9322590.1 RHS repeat-associated core domain-containing protein [Lewinellaceae bacterium]
MGQDKAESSDHREVLLKKLYYPFGMELDGVTPDTTAPMLKRLFNDKEWHEGTGWYEFRFRHYDPVIGRFTGVDPIAEKFAHVSPFNYAENEPIGHIDLWGLQKVSFNIAGYIKIGETSNRVAGKASIDIGNNYSFSYSIALEGLGGVSGTYSKEDGYKSNKAQIDFGKMFFEADRPSGLVIPKWAARIGINKAIKAFTPSSVEEGLSLSSEDHRFNYYMEFLLRSVNELIDQDILTGLYDYDGSKGQAINAEGQSYDRKFTSIYRGQFDDVEFGNDDMEFTGKVVVSYTNQKELQKDTYYEGKLPSVIELKKAGL